MAEDVSLSLNAAVLRIGPKVGVVPDTLWGWAKQQRVDAGLTPGTTSADATKIKALEQQVKELKRANDPVGGLGFLRARARPATSLVVAFIAASADRASADGLRWGVEPICAVLTEHGVKIAPSTYYAARNRPPSSVAVLHIRPGQRPRRTRAIAALWISSPPSKPSTQAPT